MLYPVIGASINFEEFTGALTTSITPAEVLTVLASVVGVGMLFFLMWLGVKKAVRTFTTAVATGKIKL